MFFKLQRITVQYCNSIVISSAIVDVNEDFELVFFFHIVSKTTINNLAPFEEKKLGRNKSNIFRSFSFVRPYSTQTS
jgi:hypothetical protein